MNKLNILILGATSAIAKAAANEFAARGDHLFLASRDTDELLRIAADLTIRHHTKIYTGKFDAADFSSHKNFWQLVMNEMERVDGILLAFGYDSNKNEDAVKIIECNLTGAVSILSCCVPYFAEQKKGFIAGISSVAGDRGKKSNFTYGAAKAGLSVYLQGLRSYLFPSGVKVITIKPGFIDTPMTFGKPGIFFAASPCYIAKRIVAAIDKSRDVIYIPWFWRYILLVIRLIPEKIFKRLSP